MSNVFPNKKIQVYGLLALLFLSVISWAYFYSQGLTLAYSDAMSHLNLARLVFDNKEAGMAQIGGVWLPLNHLLSLMFIRNDWAWHSGLAGSVFSMASYIGSAVLIYLTINLLTKNRVAASVGTLVFALNLNMLYLQSTPLTEALYLFFFIFSVYLFCLFVIEDGSKYLFLIGFVGFLQVLSRYDGWFVVLLEVLALFLIDFFYHKHKWTESFGKAMVVSSPIGFGVMLWILWNVLIFGDPLFFAFGPYSAHAQQKVIDSVNDLITKGELLTSFKAYYFAAASNVGVFLMLLANVGMLAFLTDKSAFKFGVKLLLIVVFLSPVLFNVAALYLGFSILNIPELQWRPNEDLSALWFNARYGIMALPAAALLLGLLASRGRFFAILVCVTLLFQTVLMSQEGLVTVEDGTVGSSSYTNQDVSGFLEREVSREDTVLLAISFFNPVAFRSQMELSQIIHEGVSAEWNEALVNPQDYANWIVMSKNRIGDPVYESLVEKHGNAFLEYYKLAFSGKFVNIYKHSNPNVVSSARSINGQN